VSPPNFAVEFTTIVSTIAELAAVPIFFFLIEGTQWDSSRRAVLRDCGLNVWRITSSPAFALIRVFIARNHPSESNETQTIDLKEQPEQ
jgi:hypothetical protein